MSGRVTVIILCARSRIQLWLIWSFLCYRIKILYQCFRKNDITLPSGTIWQYGDQHENVWSSYNAASVYERVFFLQYPKVTYCISTSGWKCKNPQEAFSLQHNASIFQSKNWTGPARSPKPQAARPETPASRRFGPSGISARLAWPRSSMHSMWAYHLCTPLLFLVI